MIGGEGLQIRHGRNDLLHAGDGDVGVRRHRALAGVALVGDQGDGPALGDDEVRARHPDVGLADALAEVVAGEAGQVLGRRQFLVGFEAGVEQLGDLLTSTCGGPDRRCERAPPRRPG